MTNTSRLKRPLQPMPPDIAALLKQRRLEADYDARPAYQRNDYLGWIARARSQETRKKRIDQMLEELEKGGVYMNMAHQPSLKP
jgi:uncharacterized protein YdeI (YjbR/CyaY-like superfamily)